MTGVSDGITFGSLFAGIGGLDLGLERAGMACEWQVENDNYASRVLAKHWPNVRRWEDVHRFPPDDGTNWAVDLICGGFPCQPVSTAGKQKGDTDERWLWDEMHRVCALLRPRWVLAENVPGLLSASSGRLFGTVVRDLAEIGYRVEWDCIPAAAFGAPHIRNRVFVVGVRVANPDEWRCEVGGKPQPQRIEGAQGREPHGRGEVWQLRDAAPRPPGDANRSIGKDGDAPRLETEARLAIGRGYFGTEPAVGRVAHGVPARVDRLKCLGNAVVPQVAEWIGRRIIRDSRVLPR